MASWHRQSERIGVATLVVASFLLNLRHLGHAALTLYDEAFHALTARNLLMHPLRPTLVERPYLPYDYTNWLENHVWLHKPILPLWEIALSYSVFGVNTFALRLPAALLSAGAVLLTYLIGRELFDRRAAFVAATIQALTPAILSLVHGYSFSDTFDVNLLFYVELGVYFIVRAMRTGSWSDICLAGVAQGLAFLTKSYLAAIVTGVALAAWLLPVLRMGRREDTRVRGLHVLGLVALTLVISAPWTLYAMVNYPNEFFHENLYVLRHLSQDIEQWGGPWDRLVFDYSIYLYSVFYTPVLVAAFMLLGRAVSKKDTRLWLMYAWGLGVLVPLVLAAVKTPTATVFGLPPFWLLLGVLVSRATRGDRGASTAWATIAAICLLFTPAIRELDPFSEIYGFGRGYPDGYTFGDIMRDELWVVWHVAATFAVVAAVEIGVRRVGERQWADRFGAPFRWTGLGLGTAGFLFLGGLLFQASWSITERNQSEPTFSEIGEYARAQLPENAVLIHEHRPAALWGRFGDHLLTMFHSDRTGYSTSGTTADALAREVIEAGGIPYIVSIRYLPLPRLFSSGVILYQWVPSPSAERGPD